MVAAVVVVAGASFVAAEGPGVDRAATVSVAAERVAPPGETGETTSERTGGESGDDTGALPVDGGILFPMEPTPRCEVLNNFGGFSKTYGGGGHQGVDIGADLGQEVYAVEDGVLYRRFDDLSSPAGLGWGLHSATDVKYRYYHLSEFADGLEEGDTVVAGQLIGYVGDTGNATPGGWHLHFEVRPGPQPTYGSADPVDPVPLLAIPPECNVY